MFVLSLLQDVVKVDPESFLKDHEWTILLTLNRKYANKVLSGVGLCVKVFDVVEIGEFALLPGEGNAHCTVQFRMVVFRPFIGEVLVGKVKSSTREGVQVSLGFFEDIFIAAEFLQSPSAFDSEEQLWCWKYQSHDLFMDEGEEIRFRVISENFHEIPSTEVGGTTRMRNESISKAPAGGDQGDSKQPLVGKVQELGGAGKDAQQSQREGTEEGDQQLLKRAPYSLSACIDEDGLGLLSWWGGAA